MSLHTQESDIIERIRKGDEYAFERLFHTYYPRLFAFALEFVQSRDLAKDVVQEIFIKVWENRSQIRNVSVSGFLFTLVRNQCLNYLRHKKVVDNKKVQIKHTARMEELYRIDFMRDEPYPIIEKQLNEEVDRAMSQLPPKCRKVFMMSRKKGMKNKEIAEELGFSMKNVEKHLSRALKHFREHFTQQVYLPPVVIAFISSLPFF